MTTGVKNRNGSNAAKVRLRRIKILRQAQFWTITSERIARTQRKCHTNLSRIGAVIFFIWLFHKEEVSSLACHSRKEFGCRISRQQQQLFGFWSRRGGEVWGGEDRSIGENQAGDEGNDFFLVFHFLYLFIYFVIYESIFAAIFCCCYSCSIAIHFFGVVHFTNKSSLCICIEFAASKGGFFWHLWLLTKWILKPHSCAAYTLFVFML